VQGVYSDKAVDAENGPSKDEINKVDDTGRGFVCGDALSNFALLGAKEGIQCFYKVCELLEEEDWTGSRVVTYRPVLGFDPPSSLVPISVLIQGRPCVIIEPVQLRR
jgi:hypothetical protein